jgi:hypothetical protein
MAALQSVVCKGKTRRLLPHVYWHLAPRTGTVLYHNVANHEGLAHTMSLVNVVEQIDAVTPYAIKARTDAKEIAWESVRKEKFADMPQREGAIWLFDTEAAADRASDTWFMGQNRNKLRAQIVAGSTFATVDARWLDESDSSAWPSRAEKYWAGEHTGAPLEEVIVFGALYFPDWRKTPFGIGRFEGL